MPGVFYCSGTNNTFFTTCCRVAICDDQQKCPICKQDVYPFYEGMSDGDRAIAASDYYNHNTRLARSSQAHRKSQCGVR